MSIKIGNNILAKSSTYHPDLFDVKWSDHIINNISWLRADTFSWHSGKLYNRAYEHLVEDWNNSELSEEVIPGLTSFKVRVAPDGHKMVSTTNDGPERVQEVFEATGIAWYYIIDIENKRFKLPRTKFAFEGVRTAVGNYIEPGLPNITGSILDSGSGGEITYESGALYGATIPSSHRVTHVNDSNSTVGIGIDASRSNSIYGSSDTVQSPATEMYLYFYVGNYAQSDLENVAGGIQDKDTAVNYNNITNCITKIPQDIKLELNNGTLTLKAGSKFYVPNGFEEDGTTRKFDEVILTENKTDTFTSSEQIQHICFYSFGEDYPWGTAGFSRFYNDGIHFNAFSGDTQPTCDPSITSAIWYDTANNVIKCSGDKGATWKSTCRVALPLGLITVQNNTWTSIDQVFNGFGYVGSTVFALPGVKGLMPDGRNEDGTLKNKPIVITKVKAVTPTVLHNQDVAIILENNTISYNGTYRYDEAQNKTFDDSPHVLSERQSCYVGSCTLTNSVISNFKINTLFHAVDYNEFNEHRVIAFKKPTAGNNYTWYRKYSDGWVEQGGKIVSDSTTFPVAFIQEPTITLAAGGRTSSQGGMYNISLTSLSASSFTVSTYTEGINKAFWQASGLYATE